MSFNIKGIGFNPAAMTGITVLFYSSDEAEITGPVHYLGRLKKQFKHRKNVIMEGQTEKSPDAEAPG
jgi:hypothetical protein